MCVREASSSIRTRARMRSSLCAYLHALSFLLLYRFEVDLRARSALQRHPTSAENILNGFRVQTVIDEWIVCFSL
jgi:hypothetical protein